MSDQTIRSFENRLRILEWQLRFTLLVALGSMIVALLLFTRTAYAQTRTDTEVVRARAIQIVDETGQVRIGLDARSIGAPYVIPHRKPVPLFWMSDKNGHARIALMIEFGEEPALVLFDELVRPRIALRQLTGTIPGIWLFDDGGYVIFSAH